MLEWPPCLVIAAVLISVCRPSLPRRSRQGAGAVTAPFHGGRNSDFVLSNVGF